MSDITRKTIIIGGGASGMIAGIESSKKGNEVIILEKNEKLGKKIYITGKGRCNLTNNVEFIDFFNNVVRNPKFLYSAISSFSPKNTIDFFEENGLKLKVERGNRVFPESDKASDVSKTLERILVKNKVDIRLCEEVLDISKTHDTFTVKTNKNVYFCDSVIVCTGGISYPLTGSTGDGYIFAKKFGHKIIDTVPSLVGINLEGSLFKPLQGLSLKNVSISIFSCDKKIYSDFGEMLFTHFGVSGPIILSASSIINRVSDKMRLIIDLKPALDEITLDNRLIREFTDNSSCAIKTVMHGLLPSTLIDTVLQITKIDKNKKCCEITKIERKNLLFTLKNLSFNIMGLRPVDEAIVTSGGVNVNEINPKTMESKLIKGLFFAGEVIDVDAFTGGFNLQTAFSTGYLAGKNA